MARNHTFIGEGLEPGVNVSEKKNYDDRLFFDRLRWGFFFFREDPKGKIISDNKYFLINDPTTFVADAKTTIMETRRSFWYLINFCDIVEDLDEYKFSKEDEGVLSYRVLEKEDNNFQTISEVVSELAPSYMSSKEKEYIEFCSKRRYEYR